MKKIFILFCSTVCAFSIASSVSAANFQTNLFYGITDSQDVSNLQSFLKDKGVYSGPITGHFFSLTKQAVADFQSQQNISPAEGYFGPVTRERVNELSVSITPPPVSNQLTRDQQIQLLQSQIDALLIQLVSLQNVGSVAIINPMDQSSTTIPSQTTPPVDNNSGVQVPVVNTPAPKVEVAQGGVSISLSQINKPTLKIGETGILAFLTLENNSDDDVQLLKANISVTHNNEEMALNASQLIILVGAQNIQTNPVIVKHGTSAMLSVVLQTGPQKEGTFTVAVDGFSMTGMISGDKISSVSGLPLLLGSFTVIKSDSN